MVVSILPLARITAGDNDRKTFPAEELRQLADSIREQGLAQPITVRPVGDGWEIVAGERRYRAHCLLAADGGTPTPATDGSPGIPAIVRELTDREAADIMLAENTSRADLDPFAELSSPRPSQSPAVSLFPASPHN